MTEYDILKNLQTQILNIEDSLTEIESLITTRIVQCNKVDATKSDSGEVGLFSRIKLLCFERGMTVAELERRSGLSNGAVDSWDDSCPRIDNVIAVAKALNVSLDNLLYGVTFEKHEKKSSGSYEVFRKLLQKNGIKPINVSKATGIATATLSDWKKGVYTPKVNKLRLIANFFGVPVDLFLTGEE